MLSKSLTDLADIKKTGLFSQKTVMNMIQVWFSAGKEFASLPPCSHDHPACHPVGIMVCFLKSKWQKYEANHLLHLSSWHGAFEHRDKVTFDWIHFHTGRVTALDYLDIWELLFKAINNESQFFIFCDSFWWRMNFLKSWKNRHANPMKL
jgi:hypothetical protein